MCFSLGWLASLLVWLVILCAILALGRLLVAFVLPRLGMESEALVIVAQAINIVIWAVVVIAVIYFVFDLIACLVPLGRLR
jgi:hypothetical protein